MCHKWQSYIWFLRYGAWRTEVFVIFDHFLNLYPTKNLENQNFEKLKKIPWRYYDFTNVYHKWQPYDIWLLRYGVADFFVILDNFYSFASLTTRKIKILKKGKKCLKILSFYTCVPEMTIIWCMVPEIWSSTDRIFCHFGPFFALLPS